MIKGYFSDHKTFRYRLDIWDDLFASASEVKPLIWICSSPITTPEKEENAHSTIKAIWGLTSSWGFTHAYILNLFDAICRTQRDLDRKGMKKTGPLHESTLLRVLNENPSAPVMLAWGTQGARDGQDIWTLELLQKAKNQLLCLGHTQSGAPLHPLCVAPDAKHQAFTTYTLDDIRPQLDGTDLRALHKYVEAQTEMMSLETLELRILQETGRKKKSLQKILKIVSRRGGTHLDLR